MQLNLGSPHIWTIYGSLKIKRGITVPLTTTFSDPPAGTELSPREASGSAQVVGHLRKEIRKRSVVRQT